MKGACVSTLLFIQHVAIGILQFDLEILILNVMFSDSSYILKATLSTIKMRLLISLILKSVE